ncbi:MAG: radical SAM protein [bacterium]|nr:radical SAM protein [bacterium]
MDIKSIGEETFWKDFYNRTYEKNIPFEAQFELTYNCNLKCCHCNIVPEPGKEELTTEEVCSILDQLVEAGCIMLTLTGGELFARQDCLEILAHAKKRGFYTTILTNGTLITPKVADYLHDIGINKVEISFYGVTAEIFEKITRVPGSFHRCLQGIKLLQNRNIPIILKMVVMTPNLKEFDRVKELAGAQGIRFRYSYIIMPNFDGSPGPLLYRLSPKEGVDLEMENYPSADTEEERVQKESKPFISKDQFFYCSAGRNSLAINPYGELNLCLDFHFPRYDLRKSSLAEGWNELTNWVKSAKPNKNYKCNDCKYWSHCCWCPVQGWAEMGDLSACVPYFKELAKLRAKKKIAMYG